MHGNQEFACGGFWKGKWRRVEEGAEPSGGADVLQEDEQRFTWTWPVMRRIGFLLSAGSQRYMV